LGIFRTLIHTGKVDKIMLGCMTLNYMTKKSSLSDSQIGLETMASPLSANASPIVLNQLIDSLV